MNPGLVPFGRPLVDALGWTLLHFVWQGAVIAALLAVADLLLRRGSAHTRYLVACAAMALMLAAAVGTFARAPQLAGPSSPAMRLSDAGAKALPSGTRVRPERRSARSESGPGAAAARPTRHDGSAFAWPDRATLAAVARPLIPWLVALWCAGVAFLSLRLIGGWWLTRRVLARSLADPLTPLDHVVDALRERLALSTPVRICRSAWVEVPTVIGWLRPVILLPLSTWTGLTPRQLDALLAHELAHIRRHDYLVNLVQCMVETLLFYHPAVWWVSRRVREERENCCDDIAVAVCGDPLTYARALAEFERLRAETPRLAMAATGGSLLARIQRLVGASRLDPSPNWTAGLLAAVLSLVLLTGAGLGWGMARPDTPVRFRALERQARIQAQHVVARMAEAGSRMSVVATAVARVVTVPVVGVIQPVVPVVPAVAVSPAPTVDAEGACQESHKSSCDRDPQRDAGGEDGDDVEATRRFERHGIDRGTVDALRALEFSNDDILQLHDHGLALDYVAGMRKAVEDVSADDLIQLFSHGVPVEFVRALTAEGQPDRSIDDLVTLRSHGVSSEYVQRLADAGYPNLSSEELVSLASHGVSSAYAKAMHGTGHDELSAADLVELASHGVSSTLVATLAAAGRTDVPVSELIQLGDHGVGAAYVGELARSSEEPLPTESIVALHDHGISAEWLSAMLWMGYDDPQTSDLIRLQGNGITPDYVFGFRSLGYRDLSAESLVRLRSNGVDPREVALLRGLGLRELTVNEMIAMRSNGVTADYVNRLRQAGLRPTGANEVIAMRIHGVSPEDVTAMVAYGFSSLGGWDAVQLRKNGVDASFLREAVRGGYEGLSINQMIRLRRSGVAKQESKP